LILLRSTEKRDLVRAITLATTPALIGPILGPPIGGFLTTFASWPWIFYLNIPIGLLGVLLSLRYLPNPRADEARRFDGIGFVLNAGAITALVYGLGRLGTPEGGAGDLRRGGAACPRERDAAAADHGVRLSDISHHRAHRRHLSQASASAGAVPHPADAAGGVRHERLLIRSHPARS
jgi:hypothetical protein